MEKKYFTETLNNIILLYIYMHRYFDVILLSCSHDFLLNIHLFIFIFFLDFIIFLNIFDLIFHVEYFFGTF